jgi:predicted aconitase with swiveling domain
MNTTGIALCFTVAALGACSAGQPVARDFAPSGTIGQFQPKPRGSMNSKASRSLLYVSDTKTRSVLVFSYPKGKRLGELTGFAAKPAGLCTDKAGNVYVTTQGYGDTGNQSYIYEYAHGGTIPIATIADPGLANGCSVDSTTGNLAVTNQVAQSSIRGNVVVFPGGSGPPVAYSDPYNIATFYFCSYDASGNLYASGIHPANIIDELPAGGTALEAVQLSNNISPSSMQWVNNELVIGGGEGTTHGEMPIYKVQISGTSGTVGAPILLWSRGNRRPAPNVQFWTQGNRIIGPGLKGGSNRLLEFWKFPQGGKPTKVIPSRPAPDLFGVTVSQIGS